MRSGIIAGGNWIVDHVKVIEAWPAQDTLANIVEHSRSNGGSPYNILVDLFRLGAAFPLEGVGLVGADDNGRAIIRDCGEHRIGTAQLRTEAGAETSFTDVMTVRGSGRRTFFHHRGANALLDVDDFDFTATAAKHFHLGYLLLLDRLDIVENGHPRACEILRRARAAGLGTSLDCVSEDSGRLRTIVVPALPDVDILFANDFEAEKLTGIPLRKAGSITPSSVEAAAGELIGMGVRSWVVIHSPEATHARSSRGEALWQPGLRIPASDIRGTAGAGDALAAGVLMGVHEGRPMADSLRLGVCAATASLHHPSASAGVLPVEQCLALEGRYGFQNLPSVL
jgi:sugar/nucleoside kinase (ribokinase family)